MFELTELPRCYALRSQPEAPVTNPGREPAASRFTATPQRSPRSVQTGKPRQQRIPRQAQEKGQKS
jgi:hypothetical protein